MPINYCYLATAETLYQLKDKPEGVPESEFVKLCLRRIRYKVEVKECPFPESISSDSIRNCIKLLQKWLVVEIRSVDGVRILSLHTTHDSTHAILEIKNRFACHIMKCWSYHKGFLFRIQAFHTKFSIGKLFNICREWNFQFASSTGLKQFSFFFKILLSPNLNKI